MNETRNTRRPWPGRRRAAALCAALAALALAVAGCGGGGETTGGGSTAATGSATATAPSGGLAALDAKQILDRSKAAAKAAKSASVKGEIAQGANTTRIDLTLSSGQGGFGTLEQSGAKIELVLAGKDIYVKADEKTLTQGIGGGNAEVAKLVAGKWIKAAADDPRFSSLTGLLSLPDFIEQVLSPDSTITKVAGREIGGVQTVGLKSSDKETGGTLYIATEGRPYPLLLEPTSGSNSKGAVTFTDWDQDVSPEVPPTDQVIDASKLPKG